MKVNIGPFPRWWRSEVFNTHMNKTYGYADWPSESKYTRKDKIMRVTDNVLDFLYVHFCNPLFKKERKIKIRVDNYDTWNLDYTLSLVILPVLKEFRERKKSSGFVDNEDVPKELRATKKQLEAFRKDGTIDNHYHDRWNYVLDEMIHSFECILDDDWDSQFHSGDIDIKWIPIDKDGNEVAKEDAVRYQMKKGPNDTHSFDKEGYEKANERINNGLRLFGKYYRSLWS